MQLRAGQTSGNHNWDKSRDLQDFRCRPYFEVFDFASDLERILGTTTDTNPPHKCAASAGEPASMFSRYGGVRRRSLPGARAR